MNIELIASVALVAVIMGFALAWDSNSTFGENLRNEVRLILYGFIPVGIGATLGTTARILAPVSPRAKRYHQRRTSNYQPRHAYTR
jgi:hypothetical protein